MLREEVILEIFVEVRERITHQHDGTEGEIEQLEESARSLRREIGNLAEALALTGGSVQTLAQKLSERQERLSDIEARLKLVKVAPEVLSLEVRRLEASVRTRLDHFKELLDGDLAEARKIVEALLDGPMKFTPITTQDGKRYAVTARIATGALLQVLPGPQLGRPYLDEFRTTLVQLAAA